jgi:hypothetical protein
MATVKGNFISIHDNLSHLASTPSTLLSTFLQNKQIQSYFD